MMISKNDFIFIRHRLLNKPTIPEYQIVARIAKAINIEAGEETDNPLVKARLQKQTKFDSNLIFHYTHEKRLQCNKTDIHQLWNQAFQQTPVMDTRLILETRNNRNLTRELVHRCPQLQR